MTDSGAAHLTRMSELQELELVSSAITAGAMSAIKQLKQLRKLRLTEALQLLITDEVGGGPYGGSGADTCCGPACWVLRELYASHGPGS